MFSGNDVSVPVVNTNNVNLETPLGLNNKDDVNSNANVEPTTSASLSASVSFATLLKGDKTRKSVIFRTLITPAGNRAEVAVQLESIQAISKRFANTVYGLFKLLGLLFGGCLAND
ncbi:hypothetical protein Tco_0856026 [Tanacetum coccineum]